MERAMHPFKNKIIGRNKETIEQIKKNYWYKSGRWSKIVYSRVRSPGRGQSLCFLLQGGAYKDGPEYIFLQKWTDQNRAGFLVF